MSEKTSKNDRMPHCVGIIMDGNRRWAKGKGLLLLKGHSEGGETLKKVVRTAKDFGIKNIIFYTFSTENWNRKAEEVSYLLNLISHFLQKEIDYFDSEGGRLHCVGDLSRFEGGLQKTLKQAEERTSKNTDINVYFAINYGGRQEILSAVKKIIQEQKAKAETEEITEEYFAKHLQTGDMPDPDIIIRTSGEMRLSGFLPWQSVYSELFFTKTLWPDFSKEEFEKILKEYVARERRIGK